MIESMLKVLGIKDDEAKAFIFLLENGPQTAGILSKKTGLSRPSLYGFLYKLQKMELVVESQKNGVKTFIAIPKEKMKSIFDERIKELEEAKFSVEKIYTDIIRGVATISPKIQFFEGKEGVKLVLKDMLLYRNIETKAYWPIKAMIEILSEDFFKNLNKERIKRKINTRAVWPKSQMVEVKKHPYLGVGEKFLREIRVAPKDVDFLMGYWIYENKIAFISSKKEAFGFIMESKEFAEMLSSQFEVIWNLSTPLLVDPLDTESFLKEL
jgi:HTH-type transcriptional regulator, sugar sensing transcriptional regulator